nr:MAG TPA: hypothetical protein [Caudoviricetes sp.]
MIILFYKPLPPLPEGRNRTKSSLFDGCTW